MLVINMARIALAGGRRSSLESQQAGGEGCQAGAATATATAINAGSSGAGAATSTAGEVGSCGGNETPLHPTPLSPPPGAIVPPALLACLSQHLPSGLPFFSSQRFSSLLRALHHLRVLPELGRDVHVALQQRLMSASVLVHLENASDESMSGSPRPCGQQASTCCPGPGGKSPPVQPPRPCNRLRSS